VASAKVRFINALNNNNNNNSHKEKEVCAIFSVGFIDSELIYGMLVIKYS